MSFLAANINWAIVMTQYDLRGFSTPFGRADYQISAKMLDATTGNFMAFAAGYSPDPEGWEPTDEAYVEYFDSSFEDYLAMCKRLAENCNLPRKEAIQLIVLEIIKQNKEMRAKIDAGAMMRSAYLMPLEKSNRWGKVVLAFAEAFEVNIESQ